MIYSENIKERMDLISVTMDFYGLMLIHYHIFVETEDNTYMIDL